MPSQHDSLSGPSPRSHARRRLPSRCFVRGPVGKAAAVAASSGCSRTGPRYPTGARRGYMPASPHRSGSRCRSHGVRRWTGTSLPGPVGSADRTAVAGPRISAESVGEPAVRDSHSITANLLGFWFRSPGLWSRLDQPDPPLWPLWAPARLDAPQAAAGRATHPKRPTEPAAEWHSPPLLAGGESVYSDQRIVQQGMLRRRASSRWQAAHPPGRCVLGHASRQLHTSLADSATPQ